MSLVLTADEPSAPHKVARIPAAGRPVLTGVEVLREGRVEPLLHSHATVTSAPAQWWGVVLEGYSSPACVIHKHKHEHVENFVHVVLQGSVKYEVLTRGKTLKFTAVPGTTFILPRGTVDELRWGGPTHRIAAAIHPHLLVNSVDEATQEGGIELEEHWNLTDPNIMAVLLAMRADLDAGSPAGRLYGESLANALAVYLLGRYAVRPYTPRAYKGGLPRYRLKRVLDYIAGNMSGELSLSQLSAIAGMSPHYFAELFRQSTGSAPHQFVLRQRIELAKERLRDPRRSVIEAALEAGFQNPSHFSRMFRKLVGVSPSAFQSDNC